MASHQAVNTFDSRDLVGKAEEVFDIISMVDIDETPFYRDIEKKKIVSTHPEWQTDELDDPDADNGEVEGYEYEFDASDPTVRVGNHTQIADKTFIVTETADTVRTYGRKTETARLLVNKGKELRMDQEAILLANRPSLEGSKAIPGQSAGFAAWIESNALRGAGGADGGFNEATKLVDAATNGAQRALTLALINQLQGMAYDAGANLKKMMGSSWLQGVFATFMSDANVATLRQDVSSNGSVTLNGSVDAYRGPHGKVIFEGNRVLAKAKVGGVKGALARNLYFYDPAKAAVGTLRKMHEDKDVAKTGDANKKVIKTEFTLIVENEKAHGIIADLFGLTVNS